jgi:hypothetical protein
MFNILFVLVCIVIGISFAAAGYPVLSKGEFYFRNMALIVAVDGVAFFAMYLVESKFFS